MSKVMLDAGHGGKDSGACGPDRYEKDDVLKVVMRVGEILEENGVEVCYTRTDDHYDSPYAKACKGNEEGVDFFASFHRNAASGSAYGYETLVYDEDRDEVSKEYARYLREKMSEIGFKDRGTKSRPELTVLNSTHMSAGLSEMGFIDNDGDNELFDGNFESICVAHANAILHVLGMEETDGNSSSDNTPDESVDETPSTPSVSSSLEDVARDVIAGKYGNGSDRRTNLANAGYDYDEVQRVVNAILNGEDISSNDSSCEDKDVSNENTSSSVDSDIISVANDVIAGKYGNGSDRRTRLEEEGYDYSKVQRVVNAILNGEDISSSSSNSNSTSLEDVARDVIAGKYGNGSDRRTNLANAGYDYDEVQRVVNEMLQ